MWPDVREVATGRWPGILVALGVDPASLTGRHVACPVCGGNQHGAGACKPTITLL